MSLRASKNQTSRYIVRRTYDNVVEVDLVLNSMVNSLENWYRNYYQNDLLDVVMKAHRTHLIRLYDENRFKNHKTLNDERYKFLEEVDLYVQMRRDE